MERRKSAKDKKHSKLSPQQEERGAPPPAASAPGSSESAAAVSSSKPKVAPLVVVPSGERSDAPILAHTYKRCRPAPLNVSTPSKQRQQREKRQGGATKVACMELDIGKINKQGKNGARYIG